MSLIYVIRGIKVVLRMILFFNEMYCLCFWNIFELVRSVLDLREYRESSCFIL